MQAAQSEHNHRQITMTSHISFQFSLRLPQLQQYSFRPRPKPVLAWVTLSIVHGYWKRYNLETLENNTCYGYYYSSVSFSECEGNDLEYLASITCKDSEKNRHCLPSAFLLLSILTLLPLSSSFLPLSILPLLPLFHSPLQMQQRVSQMQSGCYSPTALGPVSPAPLAGECNRGQPRQHAVQWWVQTVPT